MAAPSRRCDGARDEIAVTAYGNEVTLRGTVGSFAELRAAVGDARGIVGVAAVVEELQLRQVAHARRSRNEPNQMKLRSDLR